VQPLGLGPIVSTTLRGLSVITDKLTDIAVRYAPEDASPAVVRVAVNAGLVLVALSFVKSILSVSWWLSWDRSFAWAGFPGKGGRGVFEPGGCWVWS
jgi:hypothetical protein